MAGEDNAALLASDAERERLVDLLRTASAEGRLTVAELEERAERAFHARTRAELEQLTRDLPDSPPRRSRSAPRRRPGPAREQLAAYVAVNTILILIWAATGAGPFWPIWPLLGWGIGLVGHSRPPCRNRRQRGRQLSGGRSHHGWGWEGGGDLRRARSRTPGTSTTTLP